MLDLVLVGGGLANGLLANRIATLRPEVSFALLEAGPTLGGSHTWSFHGSDVTPAQRQWLTPLCARGWEGHDVLFPGLQRTIGGTYHAIRSEDFDTALRGLLGDRVRTRSPAAEVDASRVVLASGEALEARAVIDGRGGGFDFPSGFQKFLGQDLELEGPHGLARPLLMDATVEQLDGFRFIYALPWDERRVLIEDTCYSDSRELRLQALRERIRRYVEGRGWKIARVVREESAAIPIPLGGEVPLPDRPVLGIAAGLFHATTGYSLPFAAAVAERICRMPKLDGRSLTLELNRLARNHWKNQNFFRVLNRMLFRGAEPNERLGVFSSFYRNDEALIGRFYAGQLTLVDKLKALSRGAPTVPALRALKAALWG